MVVAHQVVARLDRAEHLQHLAVAAARGDPPPRLDVVAVWRVERLLMRGGKDEHRRLSGTDCELTDERHLRIDAHLSGTP